MKRKHKQYSRPKRPFEKLRIEQEGEIREEFGLKNKKEIWKAEAKVKNMREKAKNLIKADEKEQKALFEKLNKTGIKVNSIADILSLDKKDYLNRRLQTIVFKRNLTKSVKEARQKIVHRKVFVNNKIIDKPSYLVPVELENKITIKENKKIKEPKKEEKAE
jgi:small subunit ribosomal protein S4